MTAGGTRLQTLARRTTSEREAALERCELCSEPIPPQHRHLMDLSSRELMCACRACSLLFDRGQAGGGHYRLVPDRRLRIVDLELDDALWASLLIPVDMAFFFHDSRSDRVVAFYPSPMGPTESLLELDAWEEIERSGPILRTLEPDVEALLVNRARGAQAHFVVPIEDCYRLVGLIRSNWRGLTGGTEVWDQIDGFFAELASRAKETSGEREEARWR